MKILITLLKVLGAIVMVLMLIVGMLDHKSMDLVSETVPTGPDDLAPVTLTVKSFNETPGGYLFSAREYPTQFVVTIGSQKDDIKGQVQVGQQIDVSIKAESISDLSRLFVVPVYGLSQVDGTRLFDASQTIPVQTSEAFKTTVRLADLLIGVPVLYFAGLILYPVLKGLRKRRRINHSHH